VTADSVLPNAKGVPALPLNKTPLDARSIQPRHERKNEEILSLVGLIRFSLSLSLAQLVKTSKENNYGNYGGPAAAEIGALSDCRIIRRGQQNNGDFIVGFGASAARKAAKCHLQMMH
jgi:hypothetical protein